jgi:F-type H+-transporting ATPase subunit b
VIFITPAHAQTEPEVEAHPEEPLGAPAGAAEPHESTEAHGGEHGTFPPFDPATYASQLFWLAISFGALYLLVSRVALPRIGAIIENRNNRIAADLAEAGRLKNESEAAVAAYEQVLAEARQNAHGIGQKSRDAVKAEIDAHRRGIEAGLQQKLAAAEGRIAEVKASALAEVDAIAREATETMVEVLLGAGAEKAEVAEAVKAAAAERS